MNITHQPFKVNNFDLIRLVAAFLVVINHCFAHLQLPVPAWYTLVIEPFQPVPMFFVMSGFLISASLERSKSLQQYFTNRFARIFPGLWGCIIVSIFVYWVIGGVSFFHAETVPWLFAQISGFIYTPSFLKDFGFGSYNGSLWTLFVELQFYVLLPLLYAFRKRLNINNNKFFIVLFAISLLMAFLLRRPHLATLTSSAIQKLVRYSLSSHAYLFFAGVLLQRYKIYESKLIHGKALYWVIGFLLFSYIVPLTAFSYVIAMLVLACCTISIAYTTLGRSSSWLATRDISYGVFLYHGVPLTLFVEWQLVGSFGYMLWVVGATILLAWGSYYFIEAPVMKWAKKRKTPVLKEGGDAPVATPELQIVTG
jgi:peptidoglycan/LPS O-acetylase OafA/YrhL